MIALLGQVLLQELNVLVADFEDLRDDYDLLFVAEEFGVADLVELEQGDSGLDLLPDAI